MLHTVGPEHSLLADPAYDSDGLRQRLAERGSLGRRQAHAQPQTPTGLRRFLYKERDLVERFINRIKHFRGVATRYDKLAENYFAGVQLASTRI